jgi:hypothetical protein
MFDAIQRTNDEKQTRKTCIRSRNSSNDYSDGDQLQRLGCMGKLEMKDTRGMKEDETMKRFKKAVIVAALLSATVLALSMLSAASAVWGS